MTNQQRERHEQNLDVAYMSIEAREAQGEDMSRAYVDEKTYEVKFHEASGG